MEKALSPPSEFDPRTTEVRFRIATVDYFEMTTLPEVLGYLQRHAPRIRLDIVRANSRSLEALARGEIDFVIAGESMATGPTSSTLMRRHLYRDPFSVMIRPNHPIVGKQLSLTQYLKLNHVLVSVEERPTGIVDRVLAGQGKARRIGLRLPHFTSAALAVLYSDMICTVSSTVAHRAKCLYGLCIRKPPIELPAPGIVAWWPRQHQDDPARAWFRDVFFSGKALSPQIRKLMTAPGT